MKQPLSYGIRLESDGLGWLSVRRLEERRWRVEARGFRADSDMEHSSSLQALRASSHYGVGILPGSVVKTGLARLPRLRGAEMSRALKAWVARENGARIDDMALAWRILEDEGDARRDKVPVFLAHVSKEKTKEAMSGFEEQGLRPSILLPDYLVIDQYLRATQEGIENLKAWSFVYLSGKDSILCVATNRCLLLHRTLPKDLSPGADESEFIDRLATEVQRSVHRARQSQSNLEIGAIFLGGEEHLVGLLSAELKFAQKAPVSVWRIADHIETGETPIGDDAMILAAAAVVATLDDLVLNLLPKRRKWASSPRTVRRAAISAAILASIVVPLAVGGSLFAKGRSAQRMQRAHSSLESLEPVIAKAEESDRRWRLALEREQLIASHTNGADGLERILAELALRTPPQVRLDNLKILRRGDVKFLQLSGESSDDMHADAQEAFLAFVASLDQSEFLARSDQPGELTMSEVGEDEEVGENESETQGRKRVVFSLEYRIENGERRGGGA